MKFLPDGQSPESMDKSINRAMENIAYLYDIGTPEHEAAMVLLRSEVRGVKATMVKVCQEESRRILQTADRWAAVKEP